MNFPKRHRPLPLAGFKDTHVMTYSYHGRKVFEYPFGNVLKISSISAKDPSFSFSRLPQMKVQRFNYRDLAEY